MGEQQQLMAPPDRDAEVSECGRYRFSLTRRWTTGPLLTWIGLNPSTADGVEDDHTTRRVVSLTRNRPAYGMDAGDRRGLPAWPMVGGVQLLNLVPIRSTSPEAVTDGRMPYVDVKAKYRNDMVIHGALSEASMLRLPAVIAFGQWSGSRYSRVRELARSVAEAANQLRVPLLCLGTTTHGFPRHPSRLPDDVTVMPWHPRAVFARAIDMPSWLLVREPRGRVWHLAPERRADGGSALRTACNFTMERGRRGGGETLRYTPSHGRKVCATCRRRVLEGANPAAWPAWR